MTISKFLEELRNNPKGIAFEDTMQLIDTYYDFEPSAFKNGDIHNELGQNNGSCKIFSFAQLQNLNQEETLACFGKFYREDVLQTPEGDDHQNIRNFMKTGWEGISFDKNALTLK
ncbi:HopJ type III effector protein [Arenibacter lacus]|uniref:HopJ type III effector protein n=1 Tax=Arenibacter lacus TaxID=2608629 RepID=UPI00123D2A95|nr:HopJ type III effector protein [Arenibacter lacus]